MRQIRHTEIPREDYYRIEPPGPITPRRIEDLTPEEQERIKNYKPITGNGSNSKSKSRRS